MTVSPTASEASGRRVGHNSADREVRVEPTGDPAVGIGEEGLHISGVEQCLRGGQHGRRVRLVLREVCVCGHEGGLGRAVELRELGADLSAGCVLLVGVLLLERQLVGGRRRGRGGRPVAGGDAGKLGAATVLATAGDLLRGLEPAGLAIEDAGGAVGVPLARSAARFLGRHRGGVASALGVCAGQRLLATHASKGGELCLWQVGRGLTVAVGHKSAGGAGLGHGGQGEGAESACEHAHPDRAGQGLLDASAAVVHSCFKLPGPGPARANPCMARRPGPRDAVERNGPLHDFP